MLSTGLTIAGLMGAAIFTQVPVAITNMISSGEQAQLNQDFSEFADKLESGCQGGTGSDTESDTLRGVVSLGDSSIQFADESTVILVKGSERSDEVEISCQVTPESAELEITGTTTYTIDKQGDQLVVQLG